MPTLPEPAPTLLQASRQNDVFLKVTGRFINFLADCMLLEENQNKTVPETTLFFSIRIYFLRIWRLKFAKY